jgi:hypothetical protein
MSHGRSRPVPDEISKMDLEHRVTWAFLNHDPPVNCRMTLDQFGYPNLHDTRARDDDQMLYKMTKQRRRLHRNTSKVAKQSAKRGEETSEDEQQVAEYQEKVDGGSESPDDDLLDGTVLMVDQLWLWVVSDGMSVIFLIHRFYQPLLTNSLEIAVTFFPGVGCSIACRRSFNTDYLTSCRGSPGPSRVDYTSKRTYAIVYITKLTAT